MLLELDEVKISYGGARIIRGISLGVEEGDVVCLIGANGAGKTTLLRAISGLERPNSGTIKFRGENIGQVPPPEILARGLVHVPQEGRLFGNMSVQENLLMGAYLRRDKAGVESDLRVVYDYFPILRERSRLRAGSLSGGERQMLAMGRALMSKPQVLMMEEPTAGLAPQVVQMIGQIILKMNQAGISILLVEQNAELALGVARYGYVLERGRVVVEGTAGELRRNEQVREAYLGI